MGVYAQERPGSRAASEVTSRGQHSMRGQERQGPTTATLPHLPPEGGAHVFDPSWRLLHTPSVPVLGAGTPEDLGPHGWSSPGVLDGGCYKMG